METETLPSSLDEVEANFAANGMSRDQSRYLLRANTLILSYSISNLEDLLIWL
ncbi:hypothetical protein BCIN_03g05310 [Botrytis cinerea B05.10]|uniref:Uncharacterized protein n=1 Tax=Botryotinia fuckeliana (strain B05.10) TaxID=332648 RepID=A0A384JDB2_BOTFB|nr:hypothetical protein BCIN_03g05310 [Botrytis cinerea B05.10]ATZ48304.1 hypothetical protein BCIN_03g05310 [Botrytis cinerea B05.10]